MKAVDKLRQRRPCRVTWSIEEEDAEPEIEALILNLTSTDIRLLRRNLTNTVANFKDRARE